MNYKEKIKENAVYNYIIMIKDSWTYQRLTEDEQQRLFDTISWSEKRGQIKGNYEQRWDILQAIYHSFINALGYKPIGWREPEEDIPLF